MRDIYAISPMKSVLKLDVRIEPHTMMVFNPHVK
jgi:hypothetical protein